MIFGEIFYFLILAVSVFCYWILPQRFRPAVLSVFGLGFYFFYARDFTLLLVAMTLISWVILFAGKNTDDKGVRFKSVSVIVLSVAILAYFKYWGFLGGMFNLNFSTIAVPLAISFFVFEFIHVAAEVNKGTLKNIGLLKYFSFIFFFPTMIAGPIKRYGQFEPYFEGGKLTSKDFLEAIFRIAIGLFKKMVIADNINTLINELGRPSTSSNAVLLTASIILYGFRIYLDFSGYSDIAIGSARLFGFRVPENFLHPYRQSNISAFWRHWHISLYSWLIDYVFIPLGGSRAALPRVVFNIMVVMFVSGLWHGAAWNFILWGLWHGTLLAIHKVWGDTVKNRFPEKFISSRPVQWASYALTMSCVWFGWMLFMWPLPEIRTYLQILQAQI